METGNVSAIISAAAGISGVLLGNSFAAIKEWVIHRSKRQKDTAYLAIMVVSHLDRFANGCWHVALDDGSAAQNSEQVEYEPSTKPPEFQPLDIDVEWKVLPLDLMYSILQIPDQRNQVQNRLAGIAEYDQDFPYYEDYFYARRRDYAELGLQVSDLARRLREHAMMPVKETTNPDDWNRDVSMRDIIQKLDEERKAREQREAKRESKEKASPEP